MHHSKGHCFVCCWRADSVGACIRNSYVSVRLRVGWGGDCETIRSIHVFFPVAVRVLGAGNQGYKKGQNRRPAAITARDKPHAEERHQQILLGREEPKPSTAVPLL